MSMRPPSQITGVLFIPLAAFVARESLDLKFYTQLNESHLACNHRAGIRL
jgi:hypothetical protein